MFFPIDKTQLQINEKRIKAMQLTGAGCGCLDAAIRTANSNSAPLKLDMLRLAREIEEKTPGCRLTMIRLLDREIRRQEKVQDQAA